MRRRLFVLSGRFAGLAVASSLAATVAGCGGPPRVPDGSAQVLRPVNRASSGTTLQGAVPGEGTAYQVRRHAGQMPRDLIPLPWTAIGVRQSSDEVRMTWDYGACGDPDFDVYLDETPQQVIIDVWYDPTNRPGGCESIGLSGGTTVKLAAPLGRRPLLKHRIEPPLT